MNNRLQHLLVLVVAPLTFMGVASAATSQLQDSFVVRQLSRKGGFEPAQGFSYDPETIAELTAFAAQATEVAGQLCPAIARRDVTEIGKWSADEVMVFGDWTPRKKFIAFLKEGDEELWEGLKDACEMGFTLSAGGWEAGPFTFDDSVKGEAAVFRRTEVRERPSEVAKVLEAIDRVVVMQATRTEETTRHEQWMAIASPWGRIGYVHRRSIEEYGDITVQLRHTRRGPRLAFVGND